MKIVKPIKTTAGADVPPKRLTCSEVWGGIRNTELGVSTRAVNVSLYSEASDGRRGGDIYFVSVCENETITRIALADVAGHGDAVSTMSRWVYETLLSPRNSL